MPTQWVFDENRFVSRQLDGEHIILHLDSGDYYTLDGAGGLIFGMILKRCPVGEIETALCDEYLDTDEGTLKRDLRDLVRQLESKKIIRAASP